MGITVSGGFESILVPGSAYQNYDTFRNEVAQNKAQKKENEVKRLLDKLPLTSIMLQADLIGKIDPTSKEIKDQEKKDSLQEQRKSMIDKQMNKKSKKRSNQIIKESY